MFPRFRPREAPPSLFRRRSLVANQGPGSPIPAARNVPDLGRARFGRGWGRSLGEPRRPCLGPRPPRTWPAPLPSRTALGGRHTFSAAGGRGGALIVGAPAWGCRAAQPGAPAGRVVPLFPILKSSTGEVINHPPRPPFTDGETEANGCTSGRTSITDVTFFFFFSPFLGPCPPPPTLTILPALPPMLPMNSPTRKLHLHTCLLLSSPRTPSAGCCGGLSESQWPNSCTALEVQDNCHLLKSLPGFSQLNLISSSPCSQSWLSLCPPQSGSSWRTGDTFLFIWGKVQW